MITHDEVSALRAETPGVENVLHFNNAGAALTPAPVYNAIIAFQQRERDIGANEAREENTDQISKFSTAIGDFIGAKANEIACMENATRAWDMAFYGLPLKPGDTILTAVAEFASNYIAYMQAALRKGVKIKVVPDDEHGQLDIAQLEHMIDGSVKLISIPHVPTQGGLISPAAEIGRVARKHGIFYLLDACQSVGQMTVDVNDIGCDLLTGTGRKFLREPSGTGFLYIRSGILEKLDPPFVDFHAADWTSENTFLLREGARRFENGETLNVGKIGLIEAVRYASAIGIDRIEARVQMLAEKLREALRDIRGVIVHDQGVHKCGITTFSKTGIDPDKARKVLLEQKINISISRIGYARLDLGRRGLTNILRASIHYYNTEDEINRFCCAVHRLN